MVLNKIIHDGLSHNIMTGSKISGSSSSSILSGTPTKIDEYLKDLMDKVKEGGGFVLSPAVNIPETAKPVNVRH